MSEPISKIAVTVDVRHIDGSERSLVYILSSFNTKRLYEALESLEDYLSSKGFYCGLRSKL